MREETGELGSSLGLGSPFCELSDHFQSSPSLSASVSPPGSEVVALSDPRGLCPTEKGGWGRLGVAAGPAHLPGRRRRW